MCAAHSRDMFNHSFAIPFGNTWGYAGVRRRNAGFVSVWHVSNKRWAGGLTQLLCAQQVDGKPEVSGGKEPFCANINTHPFTA